MRGSSRASPARGKALDRSSRFGGTPRPALPAPPLKRDLRQNRHRVERGRVDTFGDQFFANCRHLAAAAGEGVIGSAGCNSRAQNMNIPDRYAGQGYACL
jgi:hypothetical protein